MHHKAVAQVAAFFGRDDLPQSHLHFLRLLDAIHKADLVAQPDAVGVGHNGRFAEHIAHEEVGALAADAGQGQQFLKGGGHLTSVFVPQHPHTGRNIPRLGMSQAAGFDDGLNVLRFGGGKGGHIGVLRKQIFHHDVHPGVGALGGQTHADQQLPRMVVVQRAPGIRVFLFQPVDHLQRQRLFCGKIFRLLFPGRHPTTPFDKRLP